MKLKRKALAIFLTAFLAGGGAWATDRWDAALDTDDTAGGTDNTLWHTAPPQEHDLQAVGGVADLDWYRIFPRAKRSYEVLVLNVSGDTGGFTTDFNTLVVTRRSSTGASLLQTAVPLDTGAPATENFLRSMRWIAGADANERILVTNNDTAAGSGSIYTIMLRETTLYCPRYNNAGSQASVLILQRTNADTTALCSYTVHFFDEGGGEVGNSPGAMNFIDDVDVLPISSVTGVSGQKGGAFIGHTCGVGGFKAKMVALEPSTGFSFDTPCSEKDR